jgi:hypothetical protein
MFAQDTRAELTVNKKSLLTALLSITRIAPDEMRCAIDVGETVVLSCDSILASVSHELSGATSDGVVHFEFSASRLHKAVSHIKSDVITFKFTDKFVIINEHVIMAILGAWK